MSLLAIPGVVGHYHLIDAQDTPSSAQRNPFAPRAAEVRAAADEAYAKFKGDTSGKNADYIPVLAKVDPETSRKVRLANSERLFDQARRKVRSWGAQNVNPR